MSTIGEILKEKFLTSMGLSAYKVAQAINVPVSRIQDILHDRRRITVDTSLRLARFFGVSDNYFISLQDDIDIRNLKVELAEELGKIMAIVAAQMENLSISLQFRIAFYRKNELYFEHFEEKMKFFVKFLY